MEYYSIPEALVTYLAKIRGISRQHAHCLLHEMDEEKAQTLIAAMKLDPDYPLFVAGTYMTRDLVARSAAGNAQQAAIDERDRVNRARRAV
jgi:hypothetical protein